MFKYTPRNTTRREVQIKGIYIVDLATNKRVPDVFIKPVERVVFYNLWDVERYKERMIKELNLTKTKDFRTGKWRGNTIDLVKQINRIN